MSSADHSDAYRSRLYQSYISTHYGAIRRPGTLSTAERVYLDRNFRRYLPGDHTGRILDLGCGYGSLLLYLREKGYHDHVGVDWSGEQVQVARSRGLNAVEMGAHEYLEQNVEEFDIVFALDLIEHLNRVELLALLDGAYAALRPGGKLVLQTPNAGSPFAGRLRYDDLTHEQSFTAESIAQALRVCQFSLPEVRGVEPAVHGLMSAVRWASWQVIRLTLRSYLVVETGVMRGHIVSQNLIAVAVKG